MNGRELFRMLGNVNLPLSATVPHAASVIQQHFQICHQSMALRGNGIPKTSHGESGSSMPLACKFSSVVPRAVYKFLVPNYFIWLSFSVIIIII